MKVKIGNYPNWFGPYQLAEFLCFWAKEEEDEYGMKRKPEWVHNFGEWLAHGSIEKEDLNTRRPFLRKKERAQTKLYDFLTWIHSKRTRKIKVHIDKFDTWSMDYTLAHIILPMLKQLRDTKHGYPHIDDADAPPHLQIKDPGDNWGNEEQLSLFDMPICNPEGISVKKDQWDWILNEMIYAFECKLDDSWEDKYHSGEYDWYSEPCAWDANGKPTLYRMKEGENHTAKTDWVGLKAAQERISNGFRLFGKYYENLWD